MATLPSSRTRGRLGVPFGHDHEEEIDPAWTPNKEAQPTHDWEAPVRWWGFAKFFLFENESATGLMRIHGLFGELEVTTYQLNHKAHMHDNLWFIPGETSELHSDPRLHMSLVVEGNLRKKMWSWEFQHEPNSLTEGVHLDEWTWRGRTGGGNYQAGVR